MLNEKYPDFKLVKNLGFGDTFGDIALD